MYASELEIRVSPSKTQWLNLPPTVLQKRFSIVHKQLHSKHLGFLLMHCLQLNVIVLLSSMYLFESTSNCFFFLDYIPLYCVRSLKTIQHCVELEGYGALVIFLSLF